MRPLVLHSAAYGSELGTIFRRFWVRSGFWDELKQSVFAAFVDNDLVLFKPTEEA